MSKAATSSTSMKCHHCEERAVIRMRHHHIALCKPHYIEWFVTQTERAIRKYDMFDRNDRLLVAVSGGKDSLALWDVLHTLNFQADGLYINLGIESEDHYSEQSEQYARDFADQRGLKLHIVNVKESYGDSIPVIASRTRRGRMKPCAVCGLTKRHVMNRMARDLGYEVLATAHNLDDEVAVLMGNVMNWHMDLLSRQYPVLEAAPGFARKVKPFCRFYERETAAYSLLRGIAYIEEECPFADGSKQLYYKDMLNKIEEDMPGSKLAFYVGFLNARQAGSFNGKGETEDEKFALYTCPGCGQPTSNNGLCAFCRTMGVQIP